MDLDETWHVGLRPEKTKPCTFTAKSRDGFRREREKWVADALFFVTCTTHHFYTAFLGSISAKLCKNTCLGRISRQVVSHSRKVSIKGSNFPKKPSFSRYKKLPCL